MFVDEPKIILETHDRGEQMTFALQDELPINGQLDLLKGVYNCIQKDYGPIKTGFALNFFA